MRRRRKNAHLLLPRRSYDNKPANGGLEESADDEELEEAYELAVGAFELRDMGVLRVWAGGDVVVCGADPGERGRKEQEGAGGARRQDEDLDDGDLDLLRRLWNDVPIPWRSFKKILEDRSDRIAVSIS